MINEKIFKNKASKYSYGRLSYAPEIIDKLLYDMLTVNSVIADIGSGTGILTKEFVQNGYETYAIEPNSDMRKQAEKNLANNKCFHSVDAFAENTGLRDNSISLITVASAFHWFDVSKFKQECSRILSDNGVVCIIYNIRVYDDFSKKQSEISQKYCNEFESLTHGYDKTVSLLSSFFCGNYQTYEYDFPLEYTKEKFISRCLSSSYAPFPDSNNYTSYICEMKELLDKTFKEDKFKIDNKTVMFVGKIS